MKRKFSKISVAALAGAACLLPSHSNAAVNIVATTVASDVTFTNGTYDVIDFNVTGLTGQDAVTGDNAGNTQDAEILALQGVFTVTGGTGTTEMAAIGAGAAKQEPNFLSSAGATYGAAGSLHSSYVAFPNDANAVTVVEVGTGTKTTGNALSFGDTWSVTPSTGNGNVGGVEPGKDPQSLTLANSGSDPFATNGMLAQILVNPGATVSFAGQYVDYGYPTGNAIAFTSVGITSTTTVMGTNKIVSLVTTGAPTGTAPNGYGQTPLGTLTVTNAGGTGKYFPGYLNIPGGAATGYVAVQGFLPGDVPEVYALQVAVNGVVLSQTDTRLAAIIADIDGSDSNINTAGVTTVVGSAYASLFPGYDIIVPSSVAGGSSPYFAFDFSSPTDGDGLTGAVTVTSIAAVPEPATAAGLLLGAAGLLLGRRKNRVQAV